MIVHHDGSGLRFDGFEHGSVLFRLHHQGFGRVRERGIVLPGAQRVLHGLLNRRIDRGIDMISAGAEFVFNRAAVCARVAQPALLEKVGHHVADGILHEIRHVRHLLLLADFDDVHLLGQRAVVLILRDEARLIHARENLIRSRVGDLHLVALIHILARVIAVRRLRESGKHCALANAQLGEFLAEIVLGAALDAIVAFAEVNVVEIRFENRVFVDDGLQFKREVRFLNLALVVSLCA